MKRLLGVFLSLWWLSHTAVAADFTASLKAGKADIKFAGALAFGPDGVLFVGDSLGSAVYALDTGDRTPARGPIEVDIKNIDGKIAAMLGASRDQILLNDIAVNPISKNIYVSVSRGRGQRHSLHRPPRPLNQRHALGQLVRNPRDHIALHRPRQEAPARR